MGKVVQFPQTEDESPDGEDVTFVRGLLYPEELRELASALSAMERRDENKMGFAPPIGTTLPIASDGGTHVGNAIKVSKGQWGLYVCMNMDCDAVAHGGG